MYARVLFVYLTSFCLIGTYISSANSQKLQDSLHRLEDGYKVGSVNVIPVNASFGTPYDKFYVKKGLEYLFTFSYKEFKNKTTAIRVHVRSPNASVPFPALFVVRQQRHILSWQVPLMLENIYDYYNVSRTLCPLGTQQKTQDVMEQQILMDVSSASETPVNFHLEAVLINDFILQLNEMKTVSLTPSQPVYYKFTFPHGHDTVVVQVKSDDQLCMVFSIQDTQCPVFDLVRNVEFTGDFQTVTKKGGITVQRDQYKNGDFFVVLVIRPSDYECLGIETIIPPPGSEGSNIHTRRKFVKVIVKPYITDDQFLGAVLGAVAWFLVFYVTSLIISFIYHITDGPTEQYHEPIGSDREEVMTRPEVENEHDEDSALIGSNRGSNPQTPIVGADGPGVGTYGATVAAQGTSTEPDMADSAFSKTSNGGIPHRIPPPPEDSDSSAEEPDFDMLRDAEQDKDVFRTKTLLYVSDLARKDKRVLAKKYKLYHWNIITISIFYGLPVIQLVITYQTVLHVTGNEDICYYNFDCAMPLGVLSSFNNVFSNIGYIMLGLLFLILVFRRDMMYRKAVHKCERLEKHYGIPQHFGLFYAMGVALMMEGVLSGCYHVCPSYSNFQFDTSYMYMIGWLCMLKIYQTRHPDINPQSHIAYFVIAFIIFLAVIGVVYGTMLFWVLFTIVHLVCTMLLTAQIYYMGRWRLDMGLFQRLSLVIRSDILRCTRPLYTDRMILLIIGNIANWSLAIYGCIKQPKDFASYLLAIFIINLLMYFAFYIIMKLRSKEKILSTAILYIIMAAIVWGFAFYFFMAKLTSWEVTPALSREINEPCLLLNFYDDHDVWHFISSMALFFSFMVLLTLDDGLVLVPRDRIQVF